MLNEVFLQYIWQYALFQSGNLELTDGRSLIVLSRGILNRDAGPDFLQGKIQIGTTVWAGNIELHLKSSDWLKHHHDKDPAYENIILHVVFQHDLDTDLGNFPTLVLQPYIRPELFRTYDNLLGSPAAIPCHEQLSSVSELVWHAWLQRMLSEKWEAKFDLWNTVLKQNNNNWAELFYLVLAKMLGGRVNGDAMEELARATPLKILAKHKDNLSHLESILFGQAGLIPFDSDKPYPISLKVHYAFYKEKYQLKPIPMTRWKFLRMRPANFPTLRIAQLAMIIHEKEQLFSKLLDMKIGDEMFLNFKSGTSEFWNSHYTFGSEGILKEKHIGADLQRLIVINVVAPLTYLYGIHHGEAILKTKAMQLLEACPKENNVIIKQWKSLGVGVENAADSQALVYLYKSYCGIKQCLQCSIGHSILKRT